MVVLSGAAFFYERDTPVPTRHRELEASAWFLVLQVF